MVLTLSLDADFKVFLLKTDKMSLNFDKSDTDIKSIELIGEGDHLISKQDESR
jgi:hypothetical protein